MKQEMRKLKEQDFVELNTHQKRIKNKQKLNLVNKKIQGDEIKHAEAALRDNFIKRVQ